MLMPLRSHLRHTKERSNTADVVIEDYQNGKATVRLAESGSRLTNLPVAGTNLAAGDQAYIDYSTGQPVVRSLNIPAEDDDEIELETIDWVEESETCPADVSFYLYDNHQTNCQQAVETDLTWRYSKFDTGPFRKDGEILIPYYGLYMIICQIAIGGFQSREPFYTGDLEYYALALQDIITLSLHGDNYGLFARDTVNPIVTDSSVETTIETSGIILAKAGEIVTAKIKFESPDTSIANLLSSGFLYPRIMGFRMTKGTTQSENIIMTLIPGA